MSYSEQFKRAQQLAMKQTNHVEKNRSSADIYAEEAYGNWVSDVQATIDSQSLKNTYYSEAWVYICVNIVARKIASSPLTLEKWFLKDGSLIRVPSDDNNLINRFDNPNDFEGYTTFMYKVGSELTLMGNAIIWRLRFHKQLILLPTEIVTVETDENGKIKWYEANLGQSAEYSQITTKTIKIHPRDIIHIRLPNLNSMYWGLSPFVSGRKSVLFDKYTKEYLLNYYLRQANPGPVLEMDETANEKQAMRLLKSVELNWTGRRNQRRTMILPKGITAKNLTNSIAEQELKDHLEMNRDDIRGLLAVPPHELGIQRTGSIGSEETKAQVKNFWEQTIIPFQNLIADTLTNYFQKELGPRTFFAFDNSEVAALQVDENLRADVAIKQLNVKTLNEVRKDLYDLPPLAGGDETPGTCQNQPRIFGQTQPSSMLTETIEAEVDDNEELEEEENEKLEAELKTSGFLRKHAEWWLGRKTKTDNEVDRSERKLLENVLNMFADQAPLAIRIFKKIFKNRMKADGFLPEEERLKSELNKAFSKFEKRYTDENVPVLEGTAQVGYDTHLDTPFNLPSVEEIQAIGEREEDGRRATLKARAINNFEGFSNTTTEDIMKRVENGIKESKTLDEVAKDIFDYFGEVAPNRSKTIARTETLSAVSFGQRAAEEDAGTLIPGMKKMWVTVGDERVRHSHRNVDGDVKSIDQEFDNGLMFPRDPRGSADEVINCRCTWLMVPPEDAGQLDFDNLVFTGKNPNARL